MLSYKTPFHSLKQGWIASEFLLVAEKKVFLKVHSSFYRYIYFTWPAKYLVEKWKASRKICLQFVYKKGKCIRKSPNCFRFMEKTVLNRLSAGPEKWKAKSFFPDENNNAVVLNFFSSRYSFKTKETSRHTQNNIFFLAARLMRALDTFW